jgi:hypothetical protein
MTNRWWGNNKLRITDLGFRNYGQERLVTL